MNSFQLERRKQRYQVHYWKENIRNLLSNINLNDDQVHQLEQFYLHIDSEDILSLSNHKFDQLEKEYQKLMQQIKNGQKKQNSVKFLDQSPEIKQNAYVRKRYRLSPSSTIQNDTFNSMYNKHITQTQLQKRDNSKNKINENDPEWLNQLVHKYKKDKKVNKSKNKSRSKSPLPQQKQYQQDPIIKDVSKEIGIIEKQILYLEDKLQTHKHPDLDDELEKAQLENQSIKEKYKKLKQTNEQIVLMIKELRNYLQYQANRQLQLRQEIEQLLTY